jgi:hypothetical protein
MGCALGASGRWVVNHGICASGMLRPTEFYMPLHKIFLFKSIEAAFH